ncbi:MAG TPA: hypothetical protein VKU01_10745 [Bryobacteraceae bacterium]|nr:hypothetical protein [Bryobacteraceae bacterium]
MAISVVPGSGNIRLTNRPAVGAPVINDPTADVTFPIAQQIRAVGSARFNIGAADPIAGWFLGWLQAQWIETNWGYYRGQTNGDGSAFYQRARPPARPSQACRDTFGPVGQIFYGVEPTRRAVLPAGPSPAGGALVSTNFNDGPSDTYPLSVTNNLTHKTNWLREVQLEFHFCTVLVVRDPAGNFTQLKSFYWNTHWQYRFHASVFPMTAAHTRSEAIAGGVAANVGHVIEGAVTDRRFTGVLTSLQTQSCNDFAAAESANPNIRESRVWDNFDVRR